jgi:hypothetical protein
MSSDDEYRRTKSRWLILSGENRDLGTIADFSVANRTI